MAGLFQEFPVMVADNEEASEARAGEVGWGWDCAMSQKRPTGVKPWRTRDFTMRRLVRMPKEARARGSTAVVFLHPFSWPFGLVFMDVGVLGK